MTALANRAQVAFVRIISCAMVLFGLLGILRGRFGGFADSTGVSVLWLAANPLLNLLHLVGGIAGIAMAAGNRHRRFALVVSGLFVVVGLIGLALGSGSDPFGRDRAMMIWHLVIGVVGLVIWWTARRRSVGAS